MEFRLLGDVSVLINQVPVDIGHARQRSVLATLLVEANRTVSPDQLIDRVWGDRAPQRARESLYSYLSRLRSVLDGVEEVGIVRRSGGYLLTVDPIAVDLHRFRELVADAQRSADEVAAGLFERALTLWAGIPFADLDTPWLNSVRRRLEDERLAAELDRNDVQLRRGRHAELLTGLAARLASDPLDERIAGQLMLALYRSGRQADALDVYGRLRRRFAEHLGTDPGPALSQLHQRMLSADPTLSAPGPAVPAVRGADAPVVPRQLPAPPPLFAGRAVELAILDKQLDDRSADENRMAIAVISGVGGLGKSWLALHWAHQHLGRFPDGQLYVDLRGFDPTLDPIPTTVALRGFLDALGVSASAVPAELPAQTALYRSQIAGRRMLVVLDNARDTEHVTALLPGSPSCMVLVTSRHQLTGLVTAHGARLVTPTVLDGAEAHQLLTDMLGQDRVNTESAAVAELVAHCGGLPLALAILAARAAAHPEFPLGTLAEELKDTGGRLDALDGGEVATSLSAVFRSSCRALSAAAARLFSLLSLTHGPDLSLPAAVSLADLPAARVQVLLRQLESVHLIEQYVPGRYRMHDLVRLFADREAHEQLPVADRTAATTRLIDFYLHSAAAADRMLVPHRAGIELAEPAPGSVPAAIADQAAATAWFQAEHTCLLAAQVLAVEYDLPDRVWQLAWAAGTFHGWQGRVQDDLTMWRLGYAAAEKLADPAAQAVAHRFLGRALGRLGRYQEAMPYFERAVALLTAADDRFGAAHTHRSMAWNLERQGDFDEALGHAEESLRLYRESDAPAWMAEALELVGWYQALLSRYELAQANCEQALLLHETTGNQEGAANALSSLGYIAHHAGKSAEALEYYGAALSLQQTLGAVAHEAATLVSLGDVHESFGRPAEARSVWRRALEIYRGQHRANEAARIEQKIADLPS